jgi:hypothetical protein
MALEILARLILDMPGAGSRQVHTWNSPYDVGHASSDAMKNEPLSSFLCIFRIELGRVVRSLRNL